MSKIDNNIWLGNIHNAHDKDFLKEHNITHVLSCAKEIKRPEFPIKYHSLPITDDKVNSRTESLFREGAAVLNNWVRAGHKVIVHCMGGISRSDSVVLAYYMIYKGYTYDMAYSFIQSRRPAIHIHPLYVPILKRIERSIQQKTRRVHPSRIIILNPNQTKYLVGKESYFIKNNPDISDSVKKEMELLFTRKINNPKESSDPDEIKYYSHKLRDIKDVVKGRITFGDIRYTEIDSQWYSYTYPQYVPDGRPFSFPGGKPKQRNTNITCALRELYEETGIDLTKKPYSLTKLIDNDIIHNNYKATYYITDKDEYKNMLSDIHIKNRSPNAELHELQFININVPNVSINSIREYKSLRITRKKR